MDKSKLAGREGEAEAARYLKTKGYEIVGMNYSCRYGEIDVIASNGRNIAFVEVKLRRDASFAEARDFVTPAKQRRLRSAAAMWLQSNDTPLQPRFDVIEIYTGGGRPRINHLENAFE